jgi:hypothetical protein
VPGIGTVPATPQGAQAMYISGTGSASVTIMFTRAGVFAIDFQAAGGIGSNAGNTLDFYLNGQRVTPNGSDPTPPPYPWWAGNGNRDSSVFSAYGTVPVQIPGPGKYTFQIVGRGSAGQTTVIDNVRVESLDAIFASRIPAGGQAAGQVSQANYQSQLAAQARYAQTYGLKVVAYEGGWSLGGDHAGVPIQGWAKYYDPRTGAAMSAAIDAFYRAGGEMNVLGTYDQWRLDDAANADTYPIIQGIDTRLAELPVPATIGRPVNGNTPVGLRAGIGLRAFTKPSYPAPGDWVSWIVVVPVAGRYRITASTSPGGTAAVDVDGLLLADGPGGGAIGGLVHLTAGAHAIRVQSTGGRLTIRGVTLDRVDDLPGP